MNNTLIITDKKYSINKFKIAPVALAVSLVMGGVLAGCSSTSTDSMSDADVNNDTEYTLNNMKTDADIHNASGDKSAVVSIKTDEEVDPSKQAYVGATPREEATANALKEKPLKDKQELTINFAFDSAQLNTEAMKELSSMKAMTEEFDLSNAEVIVTGHTDALGSDSYNQALSRERANAVAEYLKDEGLPIAEWEVEGAGEGKPIANNDTAPGRERNRRVVVLLIPDSSNQVSSTNGKF